MINRHSEELDIRTAEERAISFAKTHIANLEKLNTTINMDVQSLLEPLDESAQGAYFNAFMNILFKRSMIISTDDALKWKREEVGSADDDDDDDDDEE
jgi:hypothetical protein